MDITIVTVDLSLVNSTFLKSENQRPNMNEIKLRNNIKNINNHTFEKSHHAYVVNPSTV